MRAGLDLTNTTHLVKFIQEILEQNPPAKFETLEVNRLAVNSLLVVEKDIAFTKEASVRLIGGTGQPAFENSWVAYGSPYFNPAFWLDPTGLVRMRGVIKLGTVGSAAFTLPPGYRPAATVIVPVLSNNAIGRLDIAATGTVTPVSPSSNVYVSLDGIHFKL